MCSSDDRNTAVPETSASSPGPDAEAPASGSGVRGAAVPPILDPASFDHHEGFRETTLALFTEPQHNQALRVIGDLLYTLAAESSRLWPREPEGSMRHQCRAAVADLRHMQGYLSMLGRELEASVLNNHEGYLSRICNRLAPQVQEIADTLEKELGAWRGEE
jgi:hypothetical protein